MFVRLCLEKRTFFRAISGLHASINVHLSAGYLLDDGSSGLSCSVEPVWGHNIEEFQRRFDPALTNGEGPIRLKNLYFLYLMELRAIAKAGPQLEMMQFFTGDPEEDEDVRAAISRLVTVARSFQHFDESSYFSNGQDGLKDEFRRHFRNVTRIMDCVGCDKCKLWGKLQVLCVCVSSVVCLVSCVLCPVCCVHCVVSIVLCPLCWVQCVGSSVLGPVCCVLCPVCCVQCVVSSVLCPVCWVQCVGSSVLGPVCVLHVASVLVSNRITLHITQKNISM
ncbi:Endoplasmic reticulum oxidoreductin 1 [Trinorchestia longiramus]|nr:Endoplasmic reticulum oxidoreductin 1 [Trinorchestia longiramus]